MEGIMACTEGEKDIMILALYSYLNYYKNRLNEVDDLLYIEVIQDKIKTTENMIKELGAWWLLFEFLQLYMYKFHKEGNTHKKFLHYICVVF